MVIGQPRSTQRYDKQIPADEDLLRHRIIELASQYSRYGYRRVTALLRNEGWLATTSACSVSGEKKD
jgi:putative transposase